MRRLALACLVLAAPAGAQAPETDVSEARLKSSVETLAGFGTRHTLSSQTDPKRGIGAARAWGEGEFRKTSAACGGCLEIALPEKMVSGNRIPDPVRLVDVVAIQRGSERPNEVVIVQGHIDSMPSDVLDPNSDAPGANDDASGSSLVLEAARVLSRHKYPTTIVYALLSGEEQGLYGGALLAEYAKAQGWTVKAVLNNDIVGGTCGSDGVCDDSHVRVFSEGPRADADDKLRAAQRASGGENDSPSRNLSRFVGQLAEPAADGLAVRQVWRVDRAHRGGDHFPFLAAGYPAIRFTAAIENYNRQHQNVRTENGVEYGDTPDHVDFPYLAKVTRLNVRTLDRLARAPLPPVSTADSAVKTYTKLTWMPVAGAASYTIWQRRTDQPYWNDKPLKAGIAGSEATLDGVRGDDWFFGVSSVSADGAESPVASALPGGGFGPAAP
ncbi:MAG: M20/M25/M40 family metallo-hydrolase [Candidatus Andeanibacterium colombiense]|uniref:M20/M25/M40 family metallo-hydrolase n=1 Tax=Candidatus Andeanibacterium colombiense TaxID=3121345 RepID=A0AAJ5X6U0_9SPHN|nr:MAG: M20/M25/M40 family metallo-hydrolase [Sphingomonadaceae bacterium]